MSLGIPFERVYIVKSIVDLQLVVYLFYLGIYFNDESYRGACQASYRMQLSHPGKRLRQKVKDEWGPES